MSQQAITTATALSNIKNNLEVAAIALKKIADGISDLMLVAEEGIEQEDSVLVKSSMFGE